MTPKMTKDDWHILLVSIILALILPGWVVLLLPFTFILVFVLFVGIFARW